MPNEKMLRETAEFIESLLDVSILMNRINIENNKRYATYGLTTEKFHVLFFLYMDQDTPLSPSDIAEKAKITRASMTGILDSLEKNELLKRTLHPSDRRKVILELTDQGKDLIERIMPPHYEFVQKINKTFSQQERSSMAVFFKKMLDILTDLEIMNKIVTEKTLESSKKNG